MQGSAENNGSDIKRQNVEAAYALLCEVGMEGASAREIARRMGTTAPAVYRHFKSLDHLLALASVRFLMPYYENLEALAPTCANSLDVNIQGWECFAYYAFQNVAVFENLFFGNHSDGMDPINEYYELFPEEKAQIKDYLTQPTSSVDMRERDLYMLNRAVGEGYIRSEDVEYLADCDLLILRGMFQQYRNEKTDAASAHKIARLFLRLVYRNYTRCLLSGKRIMEGLSGRYAFV